MVDIVTSLQLQGFLVFLVRLYVRLISYTILTNLAAVHHVTALAIPKRFKQFINFIQPVSGLESHEQMISKDFEEQKLMYLAFNLEQFLFDVFVFYQCTIFVAWKN